MKVLLRAPLLTNSGYGVHSRQVFSWLLSKDVDLDVECLSWGNTPWVIDEKEFGGLVGEAMQRSVKLSPPYDVAFQLQLPDEWDTSLAKVNVGMSAFVETDKCSYQWVDCCNKVDKVIVPSTFTKNVVKRSGMLLKQIDVIPEWYNENITNNNHKKVDLSSVDTSFNYLMICQLTAQNPDLDRKNLINTLRWLFEYHKDDKDVGIILKTNMGRGSKRDKIHTTKYINHVVETFRKSPYPKLHFIHGNMEEKEIAGLYKNEKISAFVTATRGEGYGLPIVDAAAAGIPVIATNWSGHLEFLKEGSFIPIDYELKEISDDKIDDRIFFKNFKWAEPSKESFFDALGNLKNNYSEHRERATKGSEIVSKNFSKQNIKKMYDSLLEGLL